MNSELLKKFRENRCTESERLEIYRWLSDPRNEEEITAFLKKSWHAASSVTKSDEDVTSVSKIRQEIRSRIGKNKDQSSYDPEIPPLDHTKQRPSWKLMKAAAVVLVLISSGLVFWGVENFLPPVRPVVSKTYVDKSNPRGQKSTVFLKDGSKVILNSSSSLRYASDFGETNRDIELMGEAFFEVAENEQLPFNVISGAVTTTALGTSFNIRAYPAQKRIQVSLVTGKTRVSLNGTGAADPLTNFLDPGQALAYDNEDGTVVKDFFRVKEVLSWKDGILYFEDRKFSEVVSALEEWYDVDISVDYGDVPGSNYDGINGEFRHQSLEAVLEIMSHARDFDYALKGKNVTIKFK